MLTADLLQYTRRKGRVIPRLIDPKNAALLEIAGEMIDLVRDFEGMRRGDLEEALQNVASTEVDPPAVPPTGQPADAATGASNAASTTAPTAPPPAAAPTRKAPGVTDKTRKGLARLLLRRCDFQTGGVANPAGLREAVFDQGAALWRGEGIETFTEARHAALARAGAPLGLAPQGVEQAMFADLQENQLLESFKPVSAQGLLYRYNTAQVQGLLLKASHLELSADWPATRRLRQLFRYLKFYGLLFLQETHPQHPEKLFLRLDGPLSVLESGTRYGMNLALFLPALLLWDEPWQLDAQVRLKGKESLELQLAPDPRLKSHYPDQGQWVPDDVRELVKAFNGKTHGKTHGKISEKGGNKGDHWQAAPAEVLLTAPGNRFLVPDFVFTHTPTGRVVYVEHLAYPQPQAVAGRLEVANAWAAGSGQTGYTENTVQGASEAVAYLLAVREVPALRAVFSGGDPHTPILKGRPPGGGLPSLFSGGAANATVTGSAHRVAGLLPYQRNLTSGGVRKALALLFVGEAPTPPF